MTAVRRLLAVSAVLGLAASITFSPLLGEPARDKDGIDWRKSASSPAPAKNDQLDDSLAVAKFAENPVVVYRKIDGETLFALQVKPHLEAMPARPRDMLILIDTSASQAQGPLALSQRIAEVVANGGSGDDRFALWTVNATTRDLSNGFKKAAELQDAFKALRDEYPAGGTNLKEGLTKAIRSFERKSGRQQVVLFLGDGVSVLDPINAEQRADLCKKMIDNEIAFFSVPLGRKLDPANLHGLATGTGGAPIRLASSEQLTDLLKRLNETVSVPILYPKTFKLPAEVTEAIPEKLPPLRPDAPTLVVGRIKPGKTLAYSITGNVHGRDISLQQSEAIPEAESDNFFLVGLLEQWREAKDQPALTRADRALADAQVNNILARADLVAKAEWALEKDKVEVAQRLFEKARQLDPEDAEAKFGLEVIQRLRDGKLSKDKLREELHGKGEEQVLRIARADVGKPGTNRTRINRVLAKADEAPKGPEANPLAPPEAPNDLLKDAKARMAVEEMRITQLVDEAIRQAARVLRSDPNRALDDLKRNLETIRTTPTIGEQKRVDLSQRLERALRDVTTRGVVIKRDLEERLRLLAQAQDRIGRQTVEQMADERLQARMRVFADLMHQAREQEAAKQAQTIRQDLINQGVDVPVAATAGYQIALNAYNLHEVQELKRVSQDRYLQTLLSVERSHVPFPDEPPIQFPAPAVWRKLSDFRKARYESSGLDANETPRRTIELRDTLARPVKFDGFDDPKTMLGEALDLLAKLYDLTFDVNEAAFKAEQLADVLSTPIAEKPIPKMVNVSLMTILRKILSKVAVPSGATYIIRRDVIEITTGQFQLAEKVIRVYPVADLVIPIPNAVNQQALQQSATIFGTTPGGAIGIAGGALGIGGLGALGVGGLGALGIGGLGALGIGGLGALGVGGLPAAGGALGVGGLPAGGGALGINGGINQNFQGGGQLNLGVGGGALGYGGGQLGQYGNLGGQFGLQGGNQSQLLILLIRQVVGTPKDWAPISGINLVGSPLPGLPPPEPSIGGEGGNDLGFWPPSNALVVKGTSRIHTRFGSGPTTGGGPPGAAMGALPNNRGDFARIGPNTPKPEARVAGNVEGPKANDANKPPPPAAPVVERDPKVIWQDALARGVTDPGLIIAVADYLAQNEKFEHLAEFLKANLRLGIVVEPWVFESLALALRESKAAADEVERAEVSIADLDPQDSQNLLRAAQAMRDLKRYDRALAFCRQAASIDPDVPQSYAEALVCAESVKDPQAMEWAAGNLLRRDWSLNNEDLHSKASFRLDSLAKVLQKENHKADAERMLAAVKAQDRRDLIIRLTWQGECDLDLKVQEPSGSVCSCFNRLTVGGGTLLGDTLADMNSETYVAAQGFAGEYKLTVDRVWGRSLGDKAKLEIVQHQGTPQETTRSVTLDLKAGNTFTVNLQGGRRTSLASVPPPASLERPPPVAESTGVDQALNQLRAIADPSNTGFEQGGLRGGVSSFGVPTEPRTPVRQQPDSIASQRLAYQNKVQSIVKNSMDMTAQVVVGRDGRPGVTLTPAFNTVSKGSAVVTNPLIPGGSR